MAEGKQGDSQLHIIMSKKKEQTIFSFIPKLLNNFKVDANVTTLNRVALG
jgi:hypothetical protein